MFPDKVGSMLLDGVVNSHEYYNKMGYVPNVQSRPHG